jgi:hypothetical protein
MSSNNENNVNLTAEYSGPGLASQIARSGAAVSSTAVDDQT